MRTACGLLWLPPRMLLLLLNLLLLLLLNPKMEREQNWNSCALPLGHLASSSSALSSHILVAKCINLLPAM